MLIKHKRGWEMGEHLATPEALFLNRRAVIGGAAGLVASSFLGGRTALAAGRSILVPGLANRAAALLGRWAPFAADRLMCRMMRRFLD